MLNFQNYLKKLVRTIAIWVVILFVFAGFLGMPHCRIPRSKDDAGTQRYMGFGGIKHVDPSAYPNKPPLFVLLPLEQPLFYYIERAASALWHFAFGSPSDQKSLTP